MSASVLDPVVKGYAPTSNGQVHFWRVDGPGMPLVLLHRTPVCSGSFERMLRFLAGRRAAIALDTPGFGQSFRPEGRPATDDYARWFLEALSSLGIERFHLAGHHTGTHFAAEMAVLAPERVASLTLSGVLYASPEQRAKDRAGIGNAPAIARDGAHVTETWTLMKSLFPVYSPELVHAETLGALGSAPGRDQAFDAIFAQDLAAVLRQVRCPMQVVQAGDDPLGLTGHLERFRTDFPQVPVRAMGPGFLAAPEHQPGQFVRAILDFLPDVPGETSHPEPIVMTDRRFELVRHETGFDIEMVKAAVPEPGPGEVLVRVRAASLNRRDLSIRDLSYPATGDRFVPLSDAAGEVVAVGEGATRWRSGDRVMSAFFQAWPGGRLTLPGAFSALGSGAAGVLADHVVLAEAGLIALPDGWSFAEGACLPCAGVTAWSALMTLGGLQEDDTVLVLGTGGVALFAVQIAAAAGARPIILSSSAEKIAAARKLGAVHGINYRDVPEWASAVRDYTSGAGVNHVVELGGDGTLEQSVNCLGLNGHLALIGALAGFGGQIPALPMIFSALKASAVMVGSQADHAALTSFMAEKGIRPVIDSEFGLDQVEHAYARAGEGAFGKVVIRFDS